MFHNVKENTIELFKNMPYDMMYNTVDLVTALGMYETHMFWQVKSVPTNTSVEIKYDYDSNYNHKFFFKEAEAFYFLSGMPYNLTRGGNYPSGSTKAAVDACSYNTEDDLGEVEE